MKTTSPIPPTYEVFLSIAGVTTFIGDATSRPIDSPKKSGGGEAKPTSSGREIIVQFPLNTPAVLRVTGDEKKGFMLEPAVSDGSALIVSHEVPEATSKMDLRVLYVTQETDGRLRLRYVHFGLVAQDDKVYWVAQQKKDGELFRNRRNEVVCTDDVRPGLLNALAKLLKVEALPQGEEPTPRRTPHPRLENRQGFVEWFDDVRQVGAVCLRWNGHLVSARVHWHQCPARDNGRRFLCEGDVVSVAAISEVRDPKSSFTFEVHSEVKLVDLVQAERPDASHERGGHRQDLRPGGRRNGAHPNGRRNDRPPARPRHGGSFSVGTLLDSETAKSLEALVNRR